MSVGVGLQTRYIGGFLAITLISLLAALARFWVLRHRRRTLSFLVSDILFGLAVVIMLGVRVYDSYIMIEELKMRMRSYSEFEVMAWNLSVVWLKYSLAEMILHLLMIWLVKGAFVALYWTLVTKDGLKFSRNLAWALHASTFILVGTFVAMVSVWLTFCPNLSDNWDISAFVTLSFCSPYWGLSPQTIWMVLTLVTDIMIITIPLSALRKLRMTALERKTFPLVLFMGLVTIVSPVVRYFIMLHNQSLFKHHDTGELAHDKVTLKTFHLSLLLSYVEVMGAVLAFSMPAFRGLLKSKPQRDRIRVAEEGMAAVARKMPLRKGKTLTELAMGTTYAEEEKEPTKMGSERSGGSWSASENQNTTVDSMGSIVGGAV